MIPVVPHKAVAAVSKIGNLIGEIGCCESRMAEGNPLMDRKVVGVVFFWSGCNGRSGHLTTTAGCSVV